MEPQGRKELSTKISCGLQRTARQCFQVRRRRDDHRIGRAKLNQATWEVHWTESNRMRNTRAHDEGPKLLKKNPERGMPSYLRRRRLQPNHRLKRNALSIFPSAVRDLPGVRTNFSQNCIDAEAVVYSRSSIGHDGARCNHESDTKVPSLHGITSKGAIEDWLKRFSPR